MVAIELRKKGVDALLDQWDLSAGDDVTLFMEKGVKESQRVLVVCTDSYVAKADAGKGGVGYERLIVTSELVKNAGTNKFIPILRNVTPDRPTPNFLATRKYIDFSKDEEFVEHFEDLVRELHQQPPRTKPPLGRNPFALSPLGEQISEPISSPRAAESSTESAQPPTTSKTEPELIRTEESRPPDSSSAYTIAKTILLKGDQQSWQRLIKSVSEDSAGNLRRWRANASTPPRDIDQASTMLVDSAEQLAPLLTSALTALESGSTQFRDQSGLVLDLLNIRQWNRSGYTWLVDLPLSLVWIFHNLHGAVALNTGQLDAALELVERKVQRDSARDFYPICQQPSLLGWPPALGGNSLHGWQLISTSFQRWNWLSNFFSSEAEFLEALIAYWMTLNIHELVLMLANKAQVDWSKPESIRLDVPLSFARAGTEINQRGFLLLLQHPKKVKEIWESRGVKRNEVEVAWPQWMNQCKYWLSRSGDGWFFVNHLEHESLFKAL